MKFCGTAELFTIPGPLIVMFSVVVIVKALAKGVKMRLATSNLSEREVSVIFELSKVAVSVGPFGTVAGVQLAAMFQSPLVGFRFQVALPAAAVAPVTSISRNGVNLWRSKVLGIRGTVD